LDRYLVAAEAAGLPSLICITKLDLVLGQSGDCNGKLLEMMQVYLDIGYPVILTSTRTGEGISQLREALQGSASVFLGKSGVGKSSLLNALLPGVDLDVGEVSQVTGKGKHITSHLEMYDLGSDGAIVDTPGIREFGLWDVDERGLSAYFPEMRPYRGQCKFGLGCRHDQEPGCEVRNAVLAGEISPYRYQSYMRLLFEV